MAHAPKPKGRPSKGIIGKGSHISVNLKPELAEKIRQENEKTGVPISEIMRRAVEEYLAKK
jgi:hypothetical protein